MNLKYLQYPTSKLMLNNDFIDPDDKDDFDADLRASFQASSEKDGVVTRFINGLISHPVGVWLMIVMFTWFDRLLKRMKRDDQENDINMEFEAQYRAKIHKKMLEQNDI